MEAKKRILIIVLFSMTFSIFGQFDAFQKKEFIKGLDTLKYRVLYPDNFSENTQYPVIFFLHGSGERGSDNEKQLVHGSALFAKSQQDFPSIVIFPQCPQEDYWSNVKVNRKTKPLTLKFKYNKKPTKAMELLMNLIEVTVAKPYAKKDQIYVMGLSMGGMGTFEILYRKPDIFAAAIPICGGGNPKSAKVYATKVPLWILHGAKDDVVNPQLSIKMAAEILENGGHPNVTIYSDANHNSWDPAFAEPELLSWLFSQKK